MRRRQHRAIERWRVIAAMAIAALGTSMATSSTADAADPWRWRRPQPPPAAAAPEAGQLPSTTRSGEPVGLRVEDRGSHYEVLAQNHAPGPVQVQLALLGANNIKTVPALPARMLVPAGRTIVVARIYPLDPRQAAGFEVDLEQLPGDPGARPLDFEYRLPFGDGPIRVHQGFGGHFSHNDAANRYAVDFALAEGTPVLAARGGVVLQVESGFDSTGLDRERDGGRANYLRVLHDDGSMALYAHLKPGSTQVRVGDTVRQGQAIALSGSTGFSTAPHLHFAVQVNRGMQLEAIRFRMFAARGELKFAREGTAGAP